MVEVTAGMWARPNAACVPTAFGSFSTHVIRVCGKRCSTLLDMRCSTCTNAARYVPRFCSPAKSSVLLQGHEMKRRTLCRLVVQASTMIRITILQALVEQSTVGIGSGRGRAEGRESAQRRLDVAEVQRHALSLRSPEAIASHLSLLPRIGTPDGLRLLLCFC